MSQGKKQVRNNFRESVFKRDGYRCRVCKKVDALDAHHITDRNEMPNGGYVKENGISLCPECHLKAEKFHIYGGRIYETGFHPDDLYRRINSSKEKATKASELL